MTRERETREETKELQSAARWLSIWQRHQDAYESTWRRLIELRAERDQLRARVDALGTRDVRLHTARQRLDLEIRTLERSLAGLPVSPAIEEKVADALRKVAERKMAGRRIARIQNAWSIDPTGALQ